MLYTFVCLRTATGLDPSPHRLTSRHKSVGGKAGDGASACAADRGDTCRVPGRVARPVPVSPAAWHCALRLRCPSLELYVTVSGELT
eukprot:7385058-Prymnesium_polylepis.1